MVLDVEEADIFAGFSDEFGSSFGVWAALDVGRQIDDGQFLSNHEVLQILFKNKIMADLNLRELTFKAFVSINFLVNSHFSSFCSLWKLRRFDREGIEFGRFE